MTKSDINRLIGLLEQAKNILDKKGINTDALGKAHTRILANQVDLQDDPFRPRTMTINT